MSPEIAGLWSRRSFWKAKGSTAVGSTADIRSNVGKDRLWPTVGEATGRVVGAAFVPDRLRDIAEIVVRAQRPYRCEVLDVPGVNPLPRAVALGFLFGAAPLHGGSFSGINQFLIGRGPRL